MNNDQYKAAKLFVGIQNLEIWCATLNISKDADKSYSCGRLQISNDLASKINDLIDAKKYKINILIEKFKSIFDPNKYILHIDSDTNDINISDADGTLVTRFKNEGKDWFGRDVFTFKVKKNLYVILFYPKNGPENGRVYSIKECDWFFWQTQKEFLSNGVLCQNFPKIISKPLFNELFDLG
ncbi:MAG: hypothetical protein WC856_24065 [Methylococcaceae bacterium]|jgi:hypothetical protein